MIACLNCFKINNKLKKNFSLFLIGVLLNVGLACGKKGADQLAIKPTNSKKQANSDLTDSAETAESKNNLNEGDPSTEEPTSLAKDQTEEGVVNNIEQGDGTQEEANNVVEGKESIENKDQAEITSVNQTILPSSSDETIPSQDTTLPPPGVDGALDNEKKSKKSLTPVTEEMLRAVTDAGEEYIFLRNMLKKMSAGEDVNVNIRDKNKNGNCYTALHHAVLLGRVDVVSLLLRKGCDTNITEQKNNACPLIWAIINKDLDVCKTLLACDCMNVNLQTKNGATPLYVAVDKNNLEVVKLLLTKPTIDVSLPTKFGETPLKLAQSRLKQKNLSAQDQKSYHLIVNLLRKKGAK